MASEFEKWETNKRHVHAASGTFICEAFSPELAAKIVREHNEREQMVEALRKICYEEENNSCGCEDHTSEDCCNNTTYHCAKCIAGAALALAIPQRGKDGE